MLDNNLKHEEETWRNKNVILQNGFVAAMNETPPQRRGFRENRNKKETYT